MTSIKYLLSFTKKNWEFRDYPIKTWKNPNAGEAKVKYGAGITNWAGLVGHGETTDKAIEKLKENFELRKKNNSQLPRPGTKVPLKFASTENMQKYSGTAVDYLDRIFGLNYHKGFYSDESSLNEFILLSDDIEKSKLEIINKTRSIYNIDITDIYDEPLWKVLKIIGERHSRNTVSRSNDDMKLTFEKFNVGYEPEPNIARPDPIIVGDVITLTFPLSYQKYPEFKHGQEGRVTFRNYLMYRTGLPNDEGFYTDPKKPGRIRNDSRWNYTDFPDLKFNNFYIVKNSDWEHTFGPNKHINPNLLSEVDNSNIYSHYILFMKDGTFECIAESYNEEVPFNESQK